MDEAPAENFQDLNLDEVRIERNNAPRANNEDGSKESNNVLIKSNACFPRSEYKTRFEGTSPFDMSDPLYWGTYFRSTVRGGNCDRIARTQPIKTFDNFLINKPSRNTMPPSKTGCIISPWAYDKYNQIFNTILPKKVFKNNICSLHYTFLYDDLLTYKTDICRTVVDRFLACKGSNSKMVVYCSNEYPCIMVQIPEFTNLCPNKEQSSLYKIVIAYFTAMTNSLALNKNIPIELVIRSSFGHIIPSVSETKTSFRINIGIVPECYAEVLAQSLYSLGTEFLVPLLNGTLKLSFGQDEINLHNQNIKKHNLRRVEYWEANESARDLLCKIGDSSGRKVSAQLTRKNYYVDLLADYVHELLLSSNDVKDFVTPLERLLGKLTYGKEVSMNCRRDDFNNQKFKFNNQEHESIKNDIKFWDMIQKISSAFVMVVDITNVIENKKMKGLYCLLEKATLEFVKNSAIQQFQDGYGSSSDCEVSFQNIWFYSKKIIVHTGMRAINIALSLSGYQEGDKNIDTKFMYYETSDAIKFVKNICESSNTGTVKCLDLNHCSSTGPNSTVNLEQIYEQLNAEEKIMILDYTSSTRKKISEAIKLFIKKVPVLILINSGMKNEQMGADMNPYGTIRIIARNPDDLNKLYYAVRICLRAEERLPKQSHNIRKAYRDVGAVITNAAIYTKGEGFDYKPNAYHNDYILEYIDTESYELSEALQKMYLLFSPQSLNLKENFSLQDVISWDLEKIKFFNSNDVREIKNYYDEWDTIDHIEDMYDLNSKFTNTFVKKIAKQIRNGELDLIDLMDIERLVVEYEKNKIALLFFPPMDNLRKLSTHIGFIRGDINNWDFEKIKFFNSDEVSTVADYYDDWDMGIRQVLLDDPHIIEYLDYIYDKNAEFTNNFAMYLATQIRNDDVDLINRAKIEYLAHRYAKGVNSEDDSEDLEDSSNSDSEDFEDLEDSSNSDSDYTDFLYLL